PTPYQYGNLFQSHSCAHDEVFKAGIFPVSVTFRRNGYRQFGFQVLKAVKTKIDVVSFNGGFRFTLIDAGKMDISTCLSGLIYINLPLIKAPIVVQHGYDEFQWIVGL